MSEDYQRFVDGEIDEYAAELTNGDRVTVRDSSLVEVWADWAGWHWRAEGGDRAKAERRLLDRLMRKNPFDGFDTDWGEPGNLAGELTDAIPEGMRKLMMEWNAVADRRAMELVGLANDFVLRSRRFER